MVVPSEVRKGGVLELGSIPVNTYSKSLKDELSQARDAVSSQEETTMRLRENRRVDDVRLLPQQVRVEGPHILEAVLFFL